MSNYISHTLLCVALSLFFISLILLSPPLYAEDSNANLLGELDSLLDEAALKKETPQGKTGTGEDLLDSLLSGDIDADSHEPAGSSSKSSSRNDLFTKFSDNLSGSLMTRYTQYIDKPTKRYNDDVFTRQAFSETRLELSTWTGTENWRFKVSAWAEADNLDDTWKRESEGLKLIQDRDRQRQHVELNEIYYRLYGHRWDLTVGKTMLENGVGTIYSPADAYGAADYTDPLNPKDLGRWIAQVDKYFSDKWTLTGAFLPIQPVSKKPHANSRWMTVYSDSYAAAFPGLAAGTSLVDQEVPNICWDNASAFARIKGTVKGWDLFVSGYYGLGNEYVVVDEGHLVSQYMFFDSYSYWLPDPKMMMPHVTQATAGFSTTWNNWEFHGEALLNHTHSSEDDDFVQTMIGVTVTLDYDWIKRLHLQKIDLTNEYGREIMLDEYSSRRVLQSSKQARLGDDDLCTRADFKFNEKLHLCYLHAYQRTLHGRFHSLDLEYEYFQNKFIRLEYDRFSGSDTSYLGRWDNNDRLTVEMEIKF